MTPLTTKWRFSEEKFTCPVAPVFKASREMQRIFGHVAHRATRPLCRYAAVNKRKPINFSPQMPLFKP
jgi:hypothetical protein